MITLTGNGRLTRDPQLRTTHSGKTVATISVASDRRERSADAIYIDLIVWEGQATAAAQHLIKGQAVTFAGRFEPREYVTQAGDQRVALELHGVDLEYGAKPRGTVEASETSSQPASTGASETEDIPFQATQNGASARPSDETSHPAKYLQARRIGGASPDSLRPPERAVTPEVAGSSPVAPAPNKAPHPGAFLVCWRRRYVLSLLAWRDGPARPGRTSRP